MNGEIYNHKELKATLKDQVNGTTVTATSTTTPTTGAAAATATATATVLYYIAAIATTLSVATSSPPTYHPTRRPSAPRRIVK